MTTIAYANGIMSGDTQITNGSLTLTGINKVFRTSHCLVGIAGDARAINTLLNWWMDVEKRAYEERDFDTINRGLEMPDGIPGEYEIMVVCEETRQCFVIDDRGLSIEIGDETAIFAIGTGQEVALGAMYAGASPEEAVGIACKLDALTGGDVVTVSL